MLTAWLTGITGVIALGVLLEILLPEGQTGKYVKGAFSLHASSFCKIIFKAIRIFTVYYLIKIKISFCHIIHQPF